MNDRDVEFLIDEMDDMMDDDAMVFECQSCGTELGFDAPSICPVCGEFA